MATAKKPAEQKLNQDGLPAGGRVTNAQMRKVELERAKKAKEKSK